MIDLTKLGYVETDGVLTQALTNGTGMQFKLLPNRVDVVYRSVPVANLNDVHSDQPKWTSANGHFLAEWILNDSPIWRWLKEKGIDEVGAGKTLLGRK